MTQAPVPAETSVTPPPSAETQIPEPQRQDQTIPYARFKEVNDQLSELKRKDQEREDKERKEAEKRAKESGQFKELVDQKDAELTTLKPQLQTAQERLAAYEQLMADEIKERTKTLPEEIKAMMPEGDILQQRSWLVKAEAAAAKLSIARSPGTPAGPVGSGAQRIASAGNLEALKDEKRARIGGL